MMCTKMLDVEPGKLFLSFLEDIMIFSILNFVVLSSMDNEMIKQSKNKNSLKF